MVEYRTCFDPIVPPLPCPLPFHGGEGVLSSAEGEAASRTQSRGSQHETGGGRVANAAFRAEPGVRPLGSGNFLKFRIIPFDRPGGFANYRHRK